MTSPYQRIWRSWANRLQRLGLHNLTATLLESGGPVNVLGAQLIYMGQPVLNGLLPQENLQALAELLEEPADIATFVNDLRGEAS